MEKKPEGYTGQWQAEKRLLKRRIKKACTPEGKNAAMRKTGKSGAYAPEVLNQTEDKTMKKERQIGIRVGVPAFFALELEDVYQHSEGAHRALAFPNFVGLLVGMGLEQYRKGKALPEATQEEALEDTEEMPKGEPFFDMPPRNLHDLFREYDEAMEMEPPESGLRIRLVHAGELA
jgi:hypothetical protein